MELWEPCLVKYVWGIGMPEVLSDQVRFDFNGMEGKLEVAILKDMDPLEWFSNPIAQFYSIANGQLR
jgi:hypothetical protein